MRLTINHTTRYNYDTPVSYALQKARLRPLDGPLQTVLDWNVQIYGGSIELNYLDHHGNHVDLVGADAGVTEISLTASGEIETNDNAGVFGQVFGTAPLWHFRRQTTLTETGKGVCALARIVTDPDDPLDQLHALSAAVLSAAPYQLGKTGQRTTAEEALAAEAGVCQDHTHIFVAACRQAGVPARYVSGYLMMNDRIDQDASHAWAEAYCPALGWVGFDVSNGYSPDERYVRIAAGLDARDTAPISGMRIGRGDESMIVTLAVQQ